MMHKVLAAAFALCVVFSLTTIVLATDGENSIGGSEEELKENLKEKKIELRRDIKEKKIEFRQDVKEKKDELKEKEASKRAELKEKKVENIGKRFAYISRHLNAYLERLDKIAEKIVKRIEKLKTKGVDTSKAQAKLDESKALRDAAKLAIDKAIVDAQSVAGATDVKAATEQAAASVKDAKNALFAYHKKLVEAIRELKASRELREGTGSAESD